MACLHTIDSRWGVVQCKLKFSDFGASRLKLSKCTFIRKFVVDLSQNNHSGSFKRGLVYLSTLLIAFSFTLNFSEKFRDLSLFSAFAKNHCDFKVSF